MMVDTENLPIQSTVIIKTDDVVKLTRVRLTGILAREFGAEHHFVINRARDAVLALGCKFPEFKTRIIELSEQGYDYAVITPSHKQGLTAEEYTASSVDEVIIIPILWGSGGGFLKIILGVALIAAAFIIPFAAVGAGLKLGILGASLIFSGINELITPKNKKKENKDNPRSSSFNSGTGAADRDLPIPLLYGELRITNLPVISAMITTNFVPPDSAPSTNSPVFGNNTGFRFWGSGGVMGGGGGGKGGGGKGGGKSKSNTETPDNLFSKSYAEILVALTEGAMQGFHRSPWESIFFDNTPIATFDGGWNFTGVWVGWTNGYPGDAPIAGFTDIKREYPVNVQVKQGLSATRSLTDTLAKWLIVRIKIPSLLTIDDKGNIKETSLIYSIDINAGAGFYEVFRRTVRGKTNAAYEENAIIELPATNIARWDIRVNKISANSTDVKTQSDLYWTAFGTTQGVYKVYDNVAVLAIRLQSDQFSSIPNVGVEIRGLTHKIPHNYDGLGKTYAGAFNGSLVIGYSSNPAWILYDLLIDTVYGVGLPESLIDVWSFYECGVYNDGLVPYGSTWEPRYTFNAYLTQATNAFDVLQQVASSMRANIWWDGVSVRLTQDRPRTPTRAFTLANVVCEYGEDGRRTGGGFEYNSTDASTRNTTATARFLNKATWIEDSEVYTDVGAQARYGHRQSELQLIGCISPGQAQRACKWEVYTSVYQTEIVTFRVANEGLLVAPGEIIRITNADRQGVRLGGRIVSGVNNTLTLDASVQINPSTLPSVAVCDPITNIVKYYRVTNSSGTTKVLTLDQFLDPVPNPEAVWLLESTEVTAELFQVIKVQELDNGAYQIEAITYNASKFDYIEQNTPLRSQPVSLLPNLTQPPSAPVNLTIQESLIETQTGVNWLAQLLWGRADTLQASYEVANYNVQFKLLEDANWQSAGLTATTGYTFTNLPPNVYNFRVQTINKLGLASDWIFLQSEILGLTVKPGAVQNLALNAMSANQGLITWDTASDLDVLVGGAVLIKYSPATTNQVWHTATEITNVSGKSNSAIVPLLDGSYLAKFVDSSGNESEEFSLAITTGLQLIQNNIVATINEAPGFTGQRTNTTAINNQLQLFSGRAFDLVTNVDLVSDVDTYGDDNVLLSGTYDFAQIVNLGRIANCRITANLNSFNAEQYNNFDFIENVDLVPNVDGITNANDASVWLEIATSQNGTTFTDWQRFFVGEYSARAFKFRCQLRSTRNTINAIVDTLGVVVDMPDRLQTGVVTTSSTVAVVTSFAEPFQVAPLGANLTIQNAQAGDYASIVSLSSTQISLRCFNVNGVQVQRNVFYSVESY